MLPDSYTEKPNAIPDYFEALLNAQAPDRFSYRFLEHLGFSNAKDRQLIGVLKELRFLDEEGIPTKRYYEFLDRSQSKRVIADGVRDAFGDLFAVNTAANQMSAEEVRNKLRTLYAGAKTDQVINRIASMFVALCAEGDFEVPGASSSTTPLHGPPPAVPTTTRDEEKEQATANRRIGVASLQYHINIVLPESRDQAVFDAIFKSLRDHLGGVHE